MSIRSWIMNGNPINLAPQDPISWDNDDIGCYGGFLDTSLNYGMNIGVVLDSWFPYVSGYGYVPPWPTSWPGQGEWIKYKWKQGSIIDVGGNVAAIKDQLYNFGPLENVIGV